MIQSYWKPLQVRIPTFRRTRNAAQYQKSAPAEMTPVARWFIRPATGLKPDSRIMLLRIVDRLSRRNRALHVDAARDRHDGAVFNCVEKLDGGRGYDAVGSHRRHRGVLVYIGSDVCGRPRPRFLEYRDAGGPGCRIPAMPPPWLGALATARKKPRTGAIFSWRSKLTKSNG
jgi:hypothetical protein